MTVVRKLSQIAPSGAVPALTDQVVGVGGMATDFLYTIQQLGLAIAPGPPAGGNLNFYVAKTGNDSNPGTVGSPFLTIQRGLTVAAQYNYQGLYFPTINVADGTYLEDLTIPVIFNMLAGAYIHLLGNHSTPGNVSVLSISQGPATFLQPDGIQIDTVNSVATSNRCWSLNGGFGRLDSTYGNVNFNPLADGFGVCIYLNHGAEIFENFSATNTINIIANNIAAFITAFNNANVSWGGGTIHVPVGGLATIWWVEIVNQITFLWQSVTMTGGVVTGAYLFAAGINYIQTPSGRQSDLPGTSIGFIDTSCVFEGTFNGQHGQGLIGDSPYVDNNIAFDAWEVQDCYFNHSTSIVANNNGALHLLAGVMGGNQTFYVATTGSDTAKDGVDPARPFRTIQHAVNVAAAFDYQELYFPTISIADGAYGENVVVPLIRGLGTANLVIVGNVGTPANVTTTSLTLDVDAKVTYSGMTITTLSSAGFTSFAFAGIPTTTQLPSGRWGIFKDTSGGGVYAVANDSGSIKKVQLV